MPEPSTNHTPAGGWLNPQPPVGSAVFSIMPSINLPQLVFILLGCAVAFILLRPLLFGGRRLDPAQAYERVRTGQAVLVDVREPGEWRHGVAGPALLLPLSDLQGERRQWRGALNANKDKEFILYCASGIRSATAALRLKKEGFRAANLGAFRRWTAAGLPVRTP